MTILEGSYGYCRVSSLGQLTGGHGLDRYILQLKDLGIPQDQIFWDVDSGGNNERAGYLKILEAVRLGDARMVYVPCFDRFTRDALGWEEALKDFSKYDCLLNLIDSVGVINPKDPDSRLVSRFFAATAQYGREKILQRSLDGIQGKRDRQEPFHARFGYKLVGRAEKLEPNLDPYRDTEFTHWEIARQIFNYFFSCNGNNNRTVKHFRTLYPGRIKGGWHNDFPRDHDGLKRWLLSESFVGAIVYFAYVPEKKIVFWADKDGKPFHTPLITMEEHREIRRLITAGTKRKNAPNPINPLSGLVNCGHCGANMWSVKSGGRDKVHRYMQCRGAYPRASQDPTCDRKSSYSVEQIDVEQAVNAALLERAEQIIKFGLSAPMRENEKSEKQIKLEKRVEQYEILAKDDPNLEGALRKAQTELQDLVHRAQTETEQITGDRKALIDLAKNPDFWLLASIQEKYRLYNKFGVQASIFESQITVTVRV
jgi:site-specific DNA recombinase